MLLLFAHALRVSSREIVIPGYDRISELPESLLTQILSHLPTKDSVKTSVLASRWKNMWLNVPGLDLDCSDFPYQDDQVCYRFIDRFLGYNPESRLQKVKVKCMSEMMEGIMDRVGTAVSRGTQHLDVESSTYYLDPDGLIYPMIESMPLNLYTSKTLVSLKLSFSGLEDPDFVCMPCLRSMTLVEVHWRDTKNLEKLISGCPVLEVLTLVRDMHCNFADSDDEFMRVRSRSLKRFCVPHGELSTSRVKSTLEIDAPGLEHMSLGEDHFDSIVVKNLSSLFVVDLDIKFLVKFGRHFDPEDLSKRNEIRDFLTGISSVGHIIISQKTVQALDRYSKVGMIPKFNNLSRLQAEFPFGLLHFLPAFLECCPNLKHLILKVVYSEEKEVLELIDVPGCFLSTLECVELKRIHEWEEEEMKIASYFLENAAVLKKLILSVRNYPRPVSDSIYEDLNKLPKRSPRCRIILDRELC